jgi:hypothetical protein
VHILLWNREGGQERGDMFRSLLPVRSRGYEFPAKNGYISLNIRPKVLQMAPNYSLSSEVSEKYCYISV